MPATPTSDMVLTLTQTVIGLKVGNGSALALYPQNPQPILRLQVSDRLIRVENGAAGEVGVYVTAGPISGGRLVGFSPAGARYYDPTLPNHAYALIGVSLGAAGSGEALSVQRSGRVFHAGWGLVPGGIYMAGAEGFLLTSPPTGGFAQIIGRAIDTDTLLLSPQAIIFST